MSNVSSFSPPPDHSDLARLLLELFKGRTDRVGVGTSTTITSVEIDSELTVEEIEDDHLSQERCFSIYPLLDDGTVQFTCLDLDNKEHNPDESIEQKLRGVVAILVELGLSPLIE